MKKKLPTNPFRMVRSLDAARATFSSVLSKGIGNQKKKKFTEEILEDIETLLKEKKELVPSRGKMVNDLADNIWKDMDKFNFREFVRDHQYCEGTDDADIQDDWINMVHT